MHQAWIVAAVILFTTVILLGWPLLFPGRERTANDAPNYGFGGPSFNWVWDEDKERFVPTAPLEPISR